jgi:hypothetical protein
MWDKTQKVDNLDHHSRLLTAAYNDRDGWEMNAMALDGNVYLEDSVSPDAVERR